MASNYPASNSDHIDRVNAELEKLAPITHAEASCIQYDLHLDNDNPAYFMFYENWEFRELWQARIDAAHLAACMEATAGAAAEFTASEITLIS